MAALRDVTLAITFCLLIALLDNRPRPVARVETPYCPVDVLVGTKDLMGNIETEWNKMYRPCTELDRDELI